MKKCPHIFDKSVSTWWHMSMHIILTIFDIQGALLMVDSKSVQAGMRIPSHTAKL